MNKNPYNIITFLLSLAIFGAALIFYLKSPESNGKNDFQIVIHTETSTQNTETTVTSATITSIVSSVQTTGTFTAISSAEITETTVYRVTFPVNINTAGISELTALDGIGEVTASEIISYRENNGFFLNRQELLNVKGIGEAKLSAIWDNIFVENESFEVYEELSEEYTEYEEYTEIPETEPPAETEITAEFTSEPLVVNLNTATADELMTIPNITEEIAADILHLREEIQYFSHPYELLLVESLTQEQVAEIIKFVTVE